MEAHIGVTVLAWSFVTTSAVIPGRVVAQRPASLLRLLLGRASSAGPRLQEGLASFRPCSLPTLPAVCSHPTGNLCGQGAPATPSAYAPQN